MLVKLHETLEKFYYDSTYHGVDIDRSFERADSAIRTATSVPQISGILAQFLGDLDDSHTSFNPPGLNVSVQYGWSWRLVGNNCYVATVKKDSDAEKQGIRPGDHVLAIDGIRPTRQNIWTVGYVYYRLSPRPGMRLVVEHVDGDRQEITFRAEMKHRTGVVDYKDLEQIRFANERLRSSRHPNHHRKILADSVMVWRMHGFAFGGGEGGYDRTVDKWMKEARKRKILILDLRGNGGGAVITTRHLLGHFDAEPFVIGTYHTRDSTYDMVSIPSHQPPYEGTAIVLIDSQSASAAEITARTLQLRGKATILGDRSAGAVMTSISVPLQLGNIYQERRIEFGMSVTVADIIMPDGKSLEHHGVIPNIAVLPTPQDIAERRDPAMAFALELAGIKMKPEKAARIFKE